MLDRRATRRMTRVGRATRAMTKWAGLMTISLMAGGCTLLPFGGGGGGGGRASGNGPMAMRPELHEASANPHADCLAEDHARLTRRGTPLGQTAADAHAAGCTACACGGAGAGTGAIADAGEDITP